VKWLIKWAVRLVLLLVVVAALVLIFKDSVLRLIAEQRLRDRTGMDVRIGRFSSGLFSPVVTIENLKVFNTAEFGGTPFVDIPELHVEFDAADLARHRLHITLMRFNLAEVDVVKNELGQTNVFAVLNRVQPRSEKAGGVQKLLRDFEFGGIDVLNLSFGKAKYIDLKDSRNNREVDVHLENQIFKNVKSEADVYGMLFMIWLHSGGKLSLSPHDFVSHALGGSGRKFRDAAQPAPEAPEQAAVPAPRR
jgi:hypothetical protein